MGFKGSKGKWELLINENWCEIQTKLPLKSICAVNTNLDEMKANSLLISKAPEMLEMLQELIIQFDYNQDIDSIQANALLNAKKLIKEATEL